MSNSSKASKVIQSFFNVWATPKRIVSRLGGSKTIPPGTRILPPNRSDDEMAQLRIDAGEKLKGKQRIVLQVNSQAKSLGLKKWLKSQGSHGKLATENFDTEAADQEAEGERVAKSLETQAEKNLS